MNDTLKRLFSIKNLSGQLLLSSVFYWLVIIGLSVLGIGSQYAMLCVVGLSLLAVSTMLIIHVIADIKSIRNGGLENEV